MTPGTSKVAKRRRRIREELLATSPHCHWCGNPLDESTITIDHRVPRSRGGSNRRSNLVPSCKRCNVAKGDKLPHEFWRALASGEVAGAAGKSPARRPSPVASIEQAMRWAFGVHAGREPKREESRPC